MNEIQQVHNILQNILSNSSGDRKEQERILEEYSKKFPDNYALLLMQIILESSKESIKKLSIIMLRKCLSGFGSKLTINIWPNLQPETKIKIKKELFGVLLNEPSKPICNQLCDAIGEIAASAICSPDQPINNLTGQKINDWPEIEIEINQMLSSRNPILIFKALKILAILLSYASEYFMSQKNQLYILLCECMENYTNEIAVEAIHALRSIIITSEPENCTFFLDLHQASLKVFEKLLNQNEELATSILDDYCDIADSEPKYFRKYFANMVNIFANNFNKKFDDSTIKDKMVELLVLTCERVPSFLKKNAPLLEKVVEMIFIQIINSCEDIDKNWENPPDGFNEKLVEDSEFSSVKFSMDQINRLIGSHDDKLILGQISQSVQKLLSSPDWRYTFTSLMALSQVGEYIHDINEAKQVVDVATKHLMSEHPKIRYAACHLIGQVSEDLNPKIQSVYFEQILKPLIQLVVTDTVPRVICHACAALTNFLEGCSKPQLEPFIEDLIKVLLNVVNNGTVFVQEGAVAAISSLGSAAKDLLAKYYDEIIQYFMNLLIIKSDKKLSLLRGEILECITILSHGVGWERFQPYSDQLIKMMILFSKNLSDGFDPMKPYIITGFQRLCLIMKKHIRPYLDGIIPDLFSIIQKVFENEIKPIDDDSEVKNLIDNEEKTSMNLSTSENNKSTAKINTGTSEDASLAISMLGVFIYKLKEEFVKYVPLCIRLITPLLTTNQNQTLREESSRCMAGLVRCVRLSNEPNKDEVLIEMTKTFVESAWTAILNESDAEIILTQLNSLQEMLSNSVITWMEQSDLEAFCSRFFKLLEKSNLRKKSLINDKNRGDIEEEELNGVNQDIENEEKLHVQAISLLGLITQFHKEKMIFMYDQLVKLTLLQALSQSNRMKQYAIFIINDIFEHLPIQFFPQEWLEPFFKILEENSQSIVCFVRQAAIYGLGLFAINYSALIPAYFARLWTAIEKALVIPQGKSKTLPYLSCKEQTLSTICKIIKIHESLFENSLETVLMNWINYLPLQVDHTEAIVCHTFLVEVLVNNPNLALGKDFSNLKKVLEILAEIYKTKDSTDSLDIKIVYVFQSFLQQPLLNQGINQILPKLNNKYQTTLQEWSLQQ